MPAATLAATHSALIRSAHLHAALAERDRADPVASLKWRNLAAADERAAAACFDALAATDALGALAHEVPDATAATTAAAAAPLEWPFAMAALEARALANASALAAARGSLRDAPLPPLAAAALDGAAALLAAEVALARHELGIEVFGAYSIHVALLGAGCAPPQ